ncbi:MAG: hypothetical protein PHH44_08135 [bacterium]|nr:hypothetical protein [bacterium]
MKKLLLSLCIMLLFSQYARATQSRLDGLGSLPLWSISEDDSLIWYNPVYISNYPDYLWLELGESDGSGSADSSWGGVSCGFKDSTRTLGLFLAKPYAGNLDQIADFETNTVYNLLEPKNKIDFFYGLNTGNFPTTGLRINYASDHSYMYGRSDTGDLSCESKTHSDEFNLIIGSHLKEFGPFSGLDLALNAGIPKALDRDKAETVAPPLNTEDMEFTTKNGYYLGLSSRGTMSISEKTSLITAIAADFTNIHYQYFYTSNFYTSTYENYLWEGEWRKASYLLGASLNSKLNEKALMILALSYNRAETKDLFDETEDSGTNELNRREKKIIQDNIPINIGIEMNIWRWLTGRIGLKHDLLLYNENIVASINKTDDTTYEYKTISDDAGNATVSFGAGINIKDTVKIDLVIRKNLFFNGTYIVSGISSTLATEISLLYLF